MKENTKQPLNDEQIKELYNFLDEFYVEKTGFTWNQLVLSDSAKYLVAVSLTEFANAKTLPLLEEIARLKEEKERAQNYWLESRKKRKAKLRDLEHSLSLSKKENEELLKEISETRGIIGDYQNIVNIAHAELTSVKEQLADAKAELKQVKDAAIENYLKAKD